MKGTRHWFNQHSGVWPVAACGFWIDDEMGDDYTLWMSRVECFNCKVAVQATIEKLVPAPAPAPAPAPTRAPLASLLGLTRSAGEIDARP